MRIVSHRKLVEFYSSEGHGDAQSALERWYDTAERAQWKNLSDIKVDFPATDYVGNQHYVKHQREQIPIDCCGKIHNRTYFHTLCGYA